MFLRPSIEAGNAINPCISPGGCNGYQARQVAGHLNAAETSGVNLSAYAAKYKTFARAKTALGKVGKMGKNRPTKFGALLRHLKSIVGQGATEADADALSQRLEQAKVIQVMGDLVLYPRDVPNGRER